MKINKSLMAIAAAMFFTGGAQSAGLSVDTVLQNGHQGASAALPKVMAPQQKATLVQGIRFAANETLDFYVNNYAIEKIDKEILPEYFRPALNFFGKLNLIENRSFNDGLFAGDTKMVELAKSVKLPVKVDDWFLPFDAKAQKFIGGDASTGRDLILRLLCLATFQEGVTPVKNWSAYGSLNVAQAEAYHYVTATRNLHFANLFAAEIARKMPNSYKNQVNFLTDFIVAFNQIPNEKLYAMFDQARTELSDLTKITVNIKDIESQNWEAGLFEYSVSNLPGASFTMKKNGQPIFGEKYIGGHLYEVEIASNAGVYEKTDRANLSK